MPTLQEIMAAKKAAASPASAEEPKVEIDLGEVKEEVKTAPAIINAEVAVSTSPKPLTFAEKMALKKAVAVTPASQPLTPVSTVMDSGSAQPSPKEQATSIPAPVVVATTVSSPVKEDTTTAEVAVLSSVISSAAQKDPEQAYADIEVRINNLVNLSDTPLQNAMSDLKVALLANPNAVSLMQDSDFGKMVIALRKLVGEEAAEVTKEGVTKTRKSKKVNFQNPDEVAAAFEEI